MVLDTGLGDLDSLTANCRDGNERRESVWSCRKSGVQRHSTTRSPRVAEQMSASLHSRAAA